jgi:hypothetical protein
LFELTGAQQAERDFARRRRAFLGRLTRRLRGRRGNGTAGGVRLACFGETGADRRNPSDRIFRGSATSRLGGS